MTKCLQKANLIKVMGEKLKDRGKFGMSSQLNDETALKEKFNLRDLRIVITRKDREACKSKASSSPLWIPTSIPRICAKENYPGYQIPSIFSQAEKWIFPQKVFQGVSSSSGTSGSENYIGKSHKRRRVGRVESGAKISYLCLQNNVEDKDNCLEIKDHKELECSGSDFKFSSDSKMIEHSADQQYNEISTVKEVDNVCISSNYKPVINYKENIFPKKEREHNSSKELVSNDNVHSCSPINSHTENNEMKLEDIEIDDDMEKLISQNIINDNHNIQQFFNTLALVKPETENKDKLISQNIINDNHNIQQFINALALVKPETENKYLSDGIFEIGDKNIFSAQGIADDTRVTHISDPLSIQSNSTQNHLEAADKLKKLDYPMVEVYMDNTGVYIPGGWKRKLFQKIYPDGNEWLYTAYCSPDGQTFWNPEQVNSYCSLLLDRMDSKSIFVDKMIFFRKKVSRTHTARKPDNSMIEVDVDNIFADKMSKSDSSMVEVYVDNTGIYIPEGWERKLYKKLDPIDNKWLYPAYCSPDGHAFWNGAQVNSYCSLLCDRIDSKSILVNKMNFVKKKVRKTHEIRKPKNSMVKVDVDNMSTDQMVEVDVDNTGIYIPEGWQRKLYHTTDGSNIFLIKYCNPHGDDFWNGDKVNSYCSLLSDINCSNSINIGKMDFSAKSLSRRIKKSNNTIVEIYADNEGIYIPEGWQRKVFQLTYPDGNKICYARYYNLEGKSFANESQVKSYYSPLSDNARADNLYLKSINVGKMNFTAKQCKVHVKTDLDGNEICYVRHYSLDGKTFKDVVRWAESGEGVRLS